MNRVVQTHPCVICLMCSFTFCPLAGLVFLKFYFHAWFWVRFWRFSVNILFSSLLLVVGVEGGQATLVVCCAESQITGSRPLPQITVLPCPVDGPSLDRSNFSRLQPISFFFDPSSSVFESRSWGCSVYMVLDIHVAHARDTCRAGEAAEIFRTDEVETFRSQQCRRRSRLHSKRCLPVVTPFLTQFSSLGSFLFSHEIPAWPFFDKPFFGTRQCCTGTRPLPQITGSLFDLDIFVKSVEHEGLIENKTRPHLVLECEHLFLFNACFLGCLCPSIYLTYLRSNWRRASGPKRLATITSNGGFVLPRGERQIFKQVFICRSMRVCWGKRWEGASWREGGDDYAASQQL